jgi:hypothetical protein
VTIGGGTGTPVSAGTATLLTVAQLRQHIETDLLDAALQRFLDANEAEIVRLFGAAASVTERLAGGGYMLMLADAPASITSITETVSLVATVLAADDYYAWPGGILERLSTGTNGRSAWGELVTVVYVPADRSAQRTAVLVKLCQLDVAYDGLKWASVGSSDYQQTALDYPAERMRLLRSLAPRGGFVIA